MLGHSRYKVFAEVFDAGTATEVHAHQRADDFAVLIAEKFASKTECRVNNSAQNSVKFVHNWKNSTKRCDFLRFYLYLSDFICIFATSLMIFACLDLQH